MAKRDLPSPDVLRQLLRYEPDTGKLFWLVRVANHIPAGREALNTANSQGYLRGEIRGRAFMAHRIAWAIYHGRWPKDEIDHINGLVSDNRISNLREATKSENQWNKAAHSNNTSGYKGVSWDRRNAKWKCQIRLFGKSRHLGLFDTAEDAHAAYCAAAEKHHGEFAKTA